MLLLCCAYAISGFGMICFVSSWKLCMTTGGMYRLGKAGGNVLCSVDRMCYAVAKRHHLTVLIWQQQLNQRNQVAVS